MSADNAAFTALLLPWWRMFPPNHLTIFTKSKTFDFYKQYFALQVPFHDRESTWRRDCEAIEVLLLASLVDPPVFRAIMWKECKCMGSYLPDRFDPDSGMPCRLELTMQLVWNSPRWHLDAVAMLLSPPAARSESFKTTRATLVAMGRKRGLALEAMVIPVSIHLYFQHDEPVIHALDLLVVLHRQRLNEATQLYPFATERVRVTVTHSPVSTRLVGALRRFKATPGLRLDRLSFQNFP